MASKMAATIGRANRVNSVPDVMNHFLLFRMVIENKNFSACFRVDDRAKSWKNNDVDHQNEKI